MIGETLRKERENQKLSVQDVEKGTSIRALYIEAIEQGEYDKLPGEVYAKGFIKNYGNFLNLDGDALVRQFIVEISPTITIPEEGQDPSQNSNETSKANIETKSADTKVRIPKRKEQPETSADDEEESIFASRKYLIAAVVLIAIFAGGLILHFSGGETEVAENQPQQQETQPVSTPENPNPEPQPAPQPPPPPAPPVSGVNLQATFSDDCWTQVVVDGSLVYEGMINAGQVFDWNANQNVYVVLGNAGAAQFVMNGQSIGALGGDGEVVDKIFVR